MSTLPSDSTQKSDLEQPPQHNSEMDRFFEWFEKNLVFVRRDITSTAPQTDIRYYPEEGK